MGQGYNYIVIWAGIVNRTRADMETSWSRYYVKKDIRAGIQGSLNKWTIC